MELGQGLVITLIGMAVVFLTLIVLMSVVQLPKGLLSLFGKRSPKSQQLSSDLPQTIPPQHIAAISAAISALGLGRLNKITLIGNENWENNRYTEITEPF